MGKYIWQSSNWPQFEWDSDKLIEPLGNVRSAQGKMSANANSIGLEEQAQILIEDAQKTSAIEGEKLDLSSIRSSVARRLGLPVAGLPAQERHIEGLVEMLLDGTKNYPKELTAKRLFAWQAGLFPTGYSGLRKIIIGKWRQTAEPMQVVSGPVGKEKIHFEAPPSARVAKEMDRFLKWFKTSPPDLDGILRAAVAHLWFVTIHPFDDGNGRLARAITDMALAQDEERSVRLYSLSAQINQEKESYYRILERTQRGNCDITAWLIWFLENLYRAIERSEAIVEKTVFIAQFWKNYSHLDLNQRQRKVLQKLLEAEPAGFKGGMTNRKYVSLTKISRETAKRDLADLEDKGLVKRQAGMGRSVSYSLARGGRPLKR